MTRVPGSTLVMLTRPDTASCAVQVRYLTRAWTHSSVTHSLSIMRKKLRDVTFVLGDKPTKYMAKSIMWTTGKDSALPAKGKKVGGPGNR